jgi:hypothetical protein
MEKGTAVSVPPKRIPDPYEGESNADEGIVPTLSRRVVDVVAARLKDLGPR